MKGVTLALAGALAGPALAQSGAGTGAGDGMGMGQGGAQSGVYVLKLDDGVSKRQGLVVNSAGQVRATRNLGDGNEQPSFTVSGSTVVMVYASNNVKNLRGPSAIKCVSVDMHADGPPTIRARAQFTYSNSDRLGHPAIAGDGAGHFLVAYGANNIQGNGNTQTYALVTNADCQDLTSHNNTTNPEEDHVVLDQEPNDNVGAPRVEWDGQKFITGIYDNNGNTTYVFLTGIKADNQGGMTPYLISDNQRAFTSNIGRPTILVMSSSRALFSTPEGVNRPSERGDAVAYYNTDTAALVQNNGNTVMPRLWKKTVVAAKPDQNNIGGVDGLPGPLGGNGVYPASPTLSMAENGDVYLTTFISNGSGRRRNKKGSSSSYVARLQVSDTGYTMLAQQTGIALESSHVVSCSGSVGVVGSEQHMLAVYGAPISGFGASSLTFVNFDATKKTLSQMFAAAVTPANSDGGYLSNMLGRNPATQGRNHLNCVGDVPNVGYGATFMPHVKTFFLAPWVGRVWMGQGTAPTVTAADGRTLPEDRNALYLTFLSGVRDASAPPPPAAAPPSASNGDNGSTVTTPGTSGTPGSSTPGSSGGFTGGCTYGGNAAGTSGALAMLFLGALLLLVSRRRWS